MVKPPTKGMKNALRYPHGISGTLAPREFARFQAYVEQRAAEEGVTRFLQTDALRELLAYALDHLLAAQDTSLDANHREEAA